MKAFGPVQSASAGPVTRVRVDDRTGAAAAETELVLSFATGRELRETVTLILHRRRLADRGVQDVGVLSGVDDAAARCHGLSAAFRGLIQAMPDRERGAMSVDTGSPFADGGPSFCTGTRGGGASRSGKRRHGRCGSLFAAREPKRRPPRPPECPTERSL